MWDILTFNSFVAQDVLIFFYYIFALLVPLLLWKFRLYILKKVSFFKDINDSFMEFYYSLSKQNKIILVTLFILIFVCMELFVRMIFEAMIGYFDMHDYLYKILQQVSKGAVQ